MPGEQHDVAQFAGDPVVIDLFAEKSPQTVFVHVGFNGERVMAFAADGERRLVEIGGEDLDFGPDFVMGRLLEQENSD